MSFWVNANAWSIMSLSNLIVFFKMDNKAAVFLIGSQINF